MPLLFELVLLVLCIFGVIVLAVTLVRVLVGPPSEASVADEKFAAYERKKYLFDSNAEFALFKLLVELYSDRFYIFPQVNYSHLVQVKLPERYKKGHRSRFDKKSADFVLCDKATVVPQLVIELDGPTHAKPSVVERDGFVDGLMQHIGLPILHLAVGPYTPESVKNAVDKALAVK
jgi:hypothetical protein